MILYETGFSIHTEYAELIAEYFDIFSVRWNFCTTEFGTAAQYDCTGSAAVAAARGRREGQVQSERDSGSAAAHAGPPEWSGHGAAHRAESLLAASW